MTLEPTSASSQSRRRVHTSHDMHVFGSLLLGERHIRRARHEHFRSTPRRQRHGRSQAFAPPMLARRPEVRLACTPSTTSLRRNTPTSACRAVSSPQEDEGCECSHTQPNACAYAMLVGMHGTSIPHLEVHAAREPRRRVAPSRAAWRRGRARRRAAQSSVPAVWTERNGEVQPSVPARSRESVFRCLDGLG